ncbi:class I SAM-dependent methyltransferase [Ruficoccus sp. ZRK36]|uniref:class I SAM-dependent methyltransferase n=1 Tax=Ruficoccus sp. ZRK36 TaxID=2866311 RepID=UPI001C733920|nr:class I SAM-dependent methyltransferase [Ruficoccus sp. ZRK36]QYY34891.1 class I SAM-dependent methyltransferase [Ruficoccus sp. ZRK36]
MMELLHPAGWRDYELLDSGAGEKLERFGQYVLIRPEPQAIWQKTLDEHEWRKRADNRFSREQKDKYRFQSDVNGGWDKNSTMPESWQIRYENAGLSLNLRLALTSFGHVGLFPEQASNWDFIFETVSGWKKQRSGEAPRVLNLFAYTGAASVVARAAGADVTHVDASRPGLNWANQNMQLNGLSDIRWVYEDALKFVKREVKRGNRYNGIIMDPPPYGRGPSGEKWTLQEKLDELVGQAAQLLHPQPAFLVMSTYAAGLSAMVSENIARAHFPSAELHCGEFFLKGPNHALPMGAFLRFRA